MTLGDFWKALLPKFQTKWTVNASEMTRCHLVLQLLNCNLRLDMWCILIRCVYTVLISNRRSMHVINLIWWITIFKVTLCHLTNSKNLDFNLTWESSSANVFEIADLQMIILNGGLMFYLLKCIHQNFRFKRLIIYILTNQIVFVLTAAMWL